MDRDAGDLQPRHVATSVADMSDVEFDAYMATLPPCPGILHVDDDDPEEDARIEADIAAGRFHPHEVVGRWLDTWGKPGRLPFKEWLKSSG